MQLLCRIWKNLEFLSPHCIQSVHLPGFPNSGSSAGGSFFSTTFSSTSFSSFSTLYFLVFIKAPYFFLKMGNSSSSTRKLAATGRHAPSVRKLNHSQNNHHHDLEEEFSDLILHEVKRQRNQNSDSSPQMSSVDSPNHSLNYSSSAPGLPSTHRTSTDEPDNVNKHFTNDLIEDEYNELSDKLLGNDEANDVTRNIIPTNNDSNHSDDMNLVLVTTRAVSSEPQSILSLHDLSKVDFTKIATSNLERQAQYASMASLDSAKSPSLASTLLPKLVPVEIKWVNSVKENLNKVAIIGSFSLWRDVIKLKPLSMRPNEYSVTVNLPLGVHKLLYIINNEYRVLEQLPTATDQEGIFFNWFEILDPQKLFNHSQNQPTHSNALAPFDANIIQVAGEHDNHAIQQKLNSFLARISRENKGDVEHVEHSNEELPGDSSGTGGYESYNERLSFLRNFQSHESSSSKAGEKPYSSEIPEMFQNYDYFKNMSPDYELPEPPQLPAHLNNVLLNKMSSDQQQNHAQNTPQVGVEASVVHAAAKRPPLRRADSSYYSSNKEALHHSIPNHVILNHLMTTSIRNDVLTVACITRYSGKFVTQVMHLPADTESMT